MSVTRYLGNTSFQTSGDDLRELFTQVGTVKSVTIAGRGSGRVEMASEEEAAMAI